MSRRSGSQYQEDQEIITRLWHKDQAVLFWLYERYSGALYGIINNLIPNEEIAKETLQDVFVKIWHNADKYDAKKGRLFTWMAQIARNAAIDTLRSAQFKRGDKTERLPDYVSNDERLSEDQRQKDVGLRNVLERLDDQNRRIIDLLYFQDYTQKEVGEALNMPLGTVKSKVRKAIMQLREILRNENFVGIYVVTIFEFIIHCVGR